MRRNILMMGPLPAAQTRELEGNFTVHKLWQADDPEAFLGRIRAGVQGMVSVFGVNVSAKLIHALPALEIIAHDSVGYDSIDVAAAKDQGIVVTNAAQVSAADVADMAIALMLAVMRRIVEGDIYVRSGLWGKRGDLPLGRSPRGKTLGIVGLGAIGREVAARAEAFGMRVAYHGPRDKGAGYPFYADLGALAEVSDVLVLCCPGGERTRHLVDAAVLRRLGKAGVLVNVARGSVVNEADLIDALETGAIGGAGLDVFASEPDVPTALCKLDNVVLQPHQGSATAETRRAMAQLVVDNLRAYFEKAEVLTPI